MSVCIHFGLVLLLAKSGCSFAQERTIFYNNLQSVLLIHVYVNVAQGHFLGLIRFKDRVTVCDRFFQEKLSIFSSSSLSYYLLPFSSLFILKTSTISKCLLQHKQVIYV